MQASIPDYIEEYDAYFSSHPIITNVNDSCKNMKNSFSFKHTTYKDMYKTITCVNPRKATDCDQLPAKVLKDIAMIIYLPCT